MSYSAEGASTRDEVQAVLDDIFDTTSAECRLAGLDGDFVQSYVLKKIVLRWFAGLTTREAVNTPEWPLALVWLTEMFPDMKNPFFALKDKMHYERRR